eukprot:COSAG02_NODE_700_length_18341_cov_52.629043_12_plen_130_part_00
MTGASTRCTFDSSTKISRALAQSSLTSLSGTKSQRRSCSIMWSIEDAIQHAPQPPRVLAPRGRAPQRRLQPPTSTPPTAASGAQTMSAPLPSPALPAHRLFSTQFWNVVVLVNGEADLGYIDGVQYEFV